MSNDSNEGKDETRKANNQGNVIQNPYYDKEVKVTGLNSKVTSSPDPNDIEAITTTKNIYYDI